MNIFDINYHVPNITLPPLYDAIFSGFYEIVEFFLTIPGIDLTIETSYGNAYDIAASIGHLEIFQLLVTTFPDDCNLLTVLPNALSSQSCQLVQYVVSICPDFDFHDFSTDFYSALEEAVSLRNFELTLYLVEDLNIIDESFSASNYKSIVNKACSITDCEIFHLLFKYKGNYLRIYDIRHFLSNATKVTPNKISHFLYRYYTELQNGTITL
ncbi:hypothetical protein TRFO_38561 [Tritrichomonas foetus]|uniref:DUF3447 domain-containing protein n=1 Tax=Tritrichomonas foetus TaxID=1144522 RepID=A0A1J4J807_9EUKA|nr:hypothetical protein TRFO_38561 [Tritrichomonas foetus]|eukprot:OHS95326.1 hypothetical protein TRFO_38561 [Tritrichomonas foetus]